jgi:hypothetical protein
LILKFLSSVFNRLVRGSNSFASYHKHISFHSKYVYLYHGTFNPWRRNVTYLTLSFRVALGLFVDDDILADGRQRTDVVRGDIVPCRSLGVASEHVSETLYDNKGQ